MFEVLLFAAAIEAVPAADAVNAPSAELLEFLADWGEDEGKLLDQPGLDSKAHSKTGEGTDRKADHESQDTP